MCEFSRPYYTAPEVISGRARDETSDLYSVGIMMWESWMGYNPFKRTRSGRKRYLIEDGLKIEKRDCMPGVLDTSISEYYPKEWGEMPFDRENAGFEHRSRRGIAPKELAEGLISKLVKQDPSERGFCKAREVVNYIVDTWPDTAKPVHELYGGVMTTMRV